MNRYVLFMLAFLLTACYEDKGNYDYHPVNEVRIAGIEKEYVREKWQTLTIEPELAFSLASTDKLAYAWEVDGRKISEERRLEYDVAEDVADTPYKCRFTAIQLSDSSRYFQEFELKVVTPFEKGLMVLSEQEGKAMLSFRGENDKDGEFIKWVYRNENGSYLEGKPLSLEQPAWEYDNRVFIATSRANYMLDKNILKLEKRYDGQTMLVPETDFEMKFCIFTDMVDENPMGCAITTKGQVHIFREQNDYFSMPSPQPILTYQEPETPVTYELSKHCLISTLGFGSTCVFLGYDDREGRFLYFSKKSPVDPDQFNRVTIRTPLIGLPMLGIGSWDYKKFGSFFYDPRTNEAKVVASHNTTFSGVKEEALITLTHHDFTPTTLLKFCDATARAIFSSGHLIRQIYMNNVTAPSTILCDKLPERAEITCLKLSPDRKRLYVGVLAQETTDEFKGDLYILDAVTGDVLEVCKGAGGRLVDVIEKF